MKVILILAIFFAGQPPHVAKVEMENLDRCLSAATEFLKQDPATVDGEGLAASCIVKKPGVPA